MSEYQYYEFVAIDRPLTDNEMAGLRARSSRAEITPTSFVNTYNWGDLKGDPSDWMRRYFDAFVYVANGCSCRLALRVPRSSFTGADLGPFKAEHVLSIEETDDHWIIDWELFESENYDRFAMEEGEEWMERLAPLRDELLRGDLRPLYLGWLAGVQCGTVDDDELEPQVPPGLSQLTSAQEALTEFLEIDPDLLAAVSEESVQSRARRRANALWKSAEEAETLRLQRESEERAKQDARLRKAREAYLATLDFDRCWKNIDEQAARGTAAGYDEAKRALVDLADACDLKSSRQAFDEALHRFVMRNTRRSALMRRLVDADLWDRND